ncbi:hypothetical protein HMPREF1092_03360 [Clostridium thermobutyricum]|uniref:Uncharacterized protein n=1 Tax=Clostridium thermobutyricum TaxID=29372 RepID=N9XS24_9CLOT|nr:hypothetical protein [Clostridium thermobutyricum]ENY98421.1 hypothetical protein HMPREF1092_03360 [Clostridium thermobutyricum]
MANALEVKTMTRQQKRQQERLVKWVNTLSKDKQAIINRVVEERINKNLNNNLGNYIASFMAALVLKFEDSINMNDIQEIVVLANTLDKDKFYMKYEGDDWMKKLDIDTELLRKEMEKKFNSGITSQNSMVKEMHKDERFKNIAIKDIVIIFKEIKDKAKGIKLKEMQETEKEINEKVAYILSDEKPKGKKKVVKIETKEKEITKMKNSETLKNQFVEFAREKEKIEERKKELEEEKKKLDEEAAKINVKSDKLGQAIELLESIGM